MREFTCSPTLEVLPLNINVWVTNLKQFEITPIMEKYGLANVASDNWYPCHLWMNALNDMVKIPNVAENFVAVGMEVGKILPMPPDVENPDLPQVLIGPLKK